MLLSCEASWDWRPTIGDSFTTFRSVARIFRRGVTCMYELDALRLLLKSFWDRSRALVVLHPPFGCPHMRLLSQLTSNFQEYVKVLRWAEQQVGNISTGEHSSEPP